MPQASPFVLMCRNQSIPIAQHLLNSTLESLQSTVISTTLPVLFSVIFSISIPLNCVSLWFLWRYSRPWTPTIVFCLNLTIADLAYTLILPFQIVYYLKGNVWLFGDAFCRIVTLLSYGNMHSSTLTMMSISIERYLGIVHPLSYKALRSTRTAVLICFIIWVLVLPPLIPLMHNNLTFCVKELSMITCFDILPRDMFRSLEHFISYFGALIFFFFLIPLLIMGFCYISIILTLLHSSSTQLRETKKQTVYLIIVLLLVITVCYMPHIIMSVTHFVLYFQKESFYMGYKLSFAIVGFNCCFDPLVYYFGSHNFRQNIREKLCRCVTVGLSENTPIFSEHDMQIAPIQHIPRV
ncbi:P2Y purinoceptor 8-like [Varanus komodoensis]|uniref:G-protein coupled receptors family 1 profile domain-containing protein n=1 Tax=Varanus komodoensis TaxID=61221 RepID=A0A8D2L0J0_VARKO|nr:P2Y purinoceptor 8-like [Varanus komodoensis]XP_044288704.1 P2Y purinoceptor 8-like [Varanus komodoensis]